MGAFQRAWSIWGFYNDRTRGLSVIMREESAETHLDPARFATDGMGGRWVCAGDDLRGSQYDTHKERTR